ncbi:MAG: hypothetical protein M9887_04290 [Chitinophagales bacterium]|nr:hypothetical protein [Chitinophagales bacterium]
MSHQGDTLYTGVLSYDANGERMRVDMVESWEEDDSLMMSGAVYRRLSNLKVGKPYRIQYVLQTAGISELDSVETVLLRSSLFDQGFLYPDTATVSSHISDTFSLVFIATEPELILAINGRKSGVSPYHFYIDDYSLREGWIKQMVCPDGMQYAERGGYRYGFNGHENDDEVKGKGRHLSFGDFGYDSRLGKRWNIEPYINKFPFLSSYSTHFNNPVYFTDEDGNQPLAGPKRWTRYTGKGYQRTESNNSITFYIYDHITKKYWWINKNGNNYMYYTDKTIPANIIKGEVKPGWHNFTPNPDSYDPTPYYAAADKLGGVAEVVLATPLLGVSGYTATFLYAAFKHYSLSGGDISKIDFVDAGLDMLPVKGLFGNIILDMLSAGVDFKDGNFTTTFAGKDFTASSAEALSAMAASFLMDKHAKQLQGALKDTDPEMFKKLLPELTNVTQDFIKEVIVNKIGEGKTKED